MARRTGSETRAPPIRIPANPSARETMAIKQTSILFHGYKIAGPRNSTRLFGRTKKPARTAKTTRKKHADAPLLHLVQRLLADLMLSPSPPPTPIHAGRRQRAQQRRPSFPLRTGTPRSFASMIPLNGTWRHTRATSDAATTLLPFLNSQQISGRTLRFSAATAKECAASQLLAAVLPTQLDCMKTTPVRERA